MPRGVFKVSRMSFMWLSISSIDLMLATYSMPIHLLKKMTRDPIFSFHGFLSVDAMGYNMQHLSLLSPLAAFFSSHIWEECSKENCRPYFISFSLPSGSFLRAKKGIFVTLYPPLQIFISGKRVPVFRNNFAPIYHQIFPYPLSFTVRLFKYSSTEGESSSWHVNVKGSVHIACLFISRHNSPFCFLKYV